ncbi:diaminopimelate epimerase [Bacillus sp. 2205SS5-2]|uniref:diaminopimelate epimerase n=1 Tax=Bacillus sp. 2205SS5-2 TaxID=3109031 RepID=UPI003006F6AC
MEFDFIKCHGSGNDFILIDEREHEFDLTNQEREILAIGLCNRENSIGADGILFVMDSEHAMAKMRVYNADGSEASMCGNGLRCVARYVCEKEGVSQAIIETLKADLSVSKKPSIYENIPTYQVEVSPVSFELADLPMCRNQEEILLNASLEELSPSLSFSAVAVPNPHLIAIVEAESLRTEEQKDIAQAVNGQNTMFPDGVNVSFVSELAQGTIYVRTYERGVGFTNACGTAMSASTLIFQLARTGSVGQPMIVYNDGGMVKCVPHLQEDETYSIDLIGNATFVYEAIVDFDFHKPENSILIQKHSTLEEKEYSNLKEYAKSLVAVHLSQN